MKAQHDEQQRQQHARRREDEDAVIGHRERADEGDAGDDRRQIELIAPAAVSDGKYPRQDLGDAERDDEISDVAVGHVVEAPDQRRFQADS